MGNELHMKKENKKTQVRLVLPLTFNKKTLAKYARN